MRIARVFPRKTKASPDDPLAFFGPPNFFTEEFDEAHISVTFTWDLKKAEWLAHQWEWKAKQVKIGGPSTGMAGSNFIPGLYLKQGYVITSRGCPNRCWFCDAWKREGAIRELPITEGWNVLDSNLLACSESHIRSVFAMLKRQPEKTQFTGGLEAARLKPWMVDLLADLKPKQMFFAYDTADDYEPLRQAAKMLREGGILFPPSSHALRCYVLIGYAGDTFEKAEARLNQTLELGFTPAAMLYRPKEYDRPKEWMRFQRQWMKPAIIYRKST